MMSGFPITISSVIMFTYTIFNITWSPQECMSCVRQEIPVYYYIVILDTC